MSDREVRLTHESFAVARISHVSGNARLNGSEFRHQHYVTLEICPAEQVRSLSREWWFGHHGSLIEIAMSEAQFIELMARPNMGSGVPVTLTRLANKAVPEPPEPKSLRQEFREDFEHYAVECSKKLDGAIADLKAAITEGRINKSVLRDIASTLESAAMAVKDGMPFVANQFESRMETVVSHAAAEIEATVTQTAIRLGISEMQRLASEAPKLLDSGFVQPGHSPGHDEILPPLDLKERKQVWFPSAAVEAKLHEAIDYGLTDEQIAEQFGVDPYDILVIRNKWENQAGK